MRTWIDTNILVAVSVTSGYEFAFYLYKNGHVFEKTSYSTNPAHAFYLNSEGKYQVKIFRRSKEREKDRGWSEEVIARTANNGTEVSLTVSATRSDTKQPEVKTGNYAEPTAIKRTYPEIDLGFLDLPPNKETPFKILLALTADGHAPTEWLASLANGPEPAAAGWFNAGKVRGNSKEILEEGWGAPKHPQIKFDTPIDWETPGRTNRSWGFELHAWRFIDPVLRDYFETRDNDLLRWMLDIVQNWWVFAQNHDNENSMTWYEMSLSLRMPRLARLIIATAQSGLRYEALGLFEIALTHLDKAMDPESFNSQNNHGFYAASAALDFAKWLPCIPGSKELRDVGEERMRMMVERQFAPDGGHMEHSPDYHRMLLGSFESAINEGLIDDTNIIARIDKAAEALGWMVQPDGHLVQFGDSPNTAIAGPGRKSSNAHTEFILTDGIRGKSNPEELYVLPHTGYAFVRSPQPREPKTNILSSYLAFQGGFHSRAHKHADDLTFTWFDHGQEILVDSGRFGYVDLLPTDSPDRKKGFFYGAPERQYVESTRAHNTVEVNGNDIERRTRIPYGSALGECLEKDGTFFISGEVDHDLYVHHRVVAMRPKKGIEVVDTIKPKREPITTVRWFNLDGALDLDAKASGVSASFPRSSMKMLVSGDGDLVVPVRGQSEPMRGWRSRVDGHLEPAWSFGYQVRIEEEARLTTAFVFNLNVEN